VDDFWSRIFQTYSGSLEESPAGARKLEHRDPRLHQGLEIPIDLQRF